MVTFIETDLNVANAFKENLKSVHQDFGIPKIEPIYTLSDNFYKAAESNEAFKDSIMNSLRLMGYNISNRVNNIKPRFKKFSSYSLEERV